MRFFTKSASAPSKGKAENENKAPGALEPTTAANQTSAGASAPVMASAAPAATSAQNLAPASAQTMAPASAQSLAPPRRPAASRAPSYSRGGLFPDGDVRNERENIMDIKADVTCSWLYQQQLERHYATGHIPSEGAVVKKAKDSYACHPAHLAEFRGDFFDMIVALNVRCAITVNSRIINVLLGAQRENYDYIPISDDGLRLQVLPSMRDLPSCEKQQFAAFIQDLQLMVVWDDEPKKVLDRAETIEKTLLRMLWGGGGEDGDSEETSMRNEKGNVQVNTEPVDLEAALDAPDRRIKLTSAATVGVTLTLAMGCIALGYRALAYEVAMDGNWARLALIVTSPFQLWVGFFFFQTIIVNFVEIFGLISTVEANHKHYSGSAPRRLDRERHRLPHVTIQMPVYKEGLATVILPTVQSVMQCVSTYVKQGGSASLFINDDGMQLIPEEEGQARREFYEEHNIGWVARPGHNPRPEGEGARPFLRRGKFKKASNMNYGMSVSNRVEDKLSLVQRAPGWTRTDERAEYQRCLAEVLVEDEGRTWAEGDIRIGDYILLIDSDTRVPDDCLMDAVSEMEQSPEVAILQYTSGVMRVSDSFFEGGVEWFTNLIYTAITFVVSIGDSVPFVGHNAVLRWSAMQDAASYVDEDGYEKFWSESHVSEDFDMSLRLQCAGYECRFASYSGSGFKEGVSLTVYDELARWEKYAYGCNELMFHQLRHWPTRGPITPLFRMFLWSSIPLPKKMTICSYIGTYYAIGASWLLTLVNYFLTGWWYGHFDKYYLDSFSIFIAVMVVFTGFSNVSLTILRYRLKEATLFGSLWENIKWIPLMVTFLGGISLHVSQALVFHFLGIEMTWGATAKEVEEVNWFEEAPRLLRRFKGTFTFCLAIVALIVCGLFYFPHEWRITYFASIWPLAWLAGSHFLLPIALNPALMKFAW
ncbi:glycosyl transferase family group 2-domain-containing protein [Xylariaceae sp. FL0804]|nr:glycosyl transferase family group 2-domain-containing protein [Xylariaceae sp. FL0804]